jgi:hypothetical protein
MADSLLAQMQMRLMEVGKTRLRKAKAEGYVVE